MFRRMLGLVQMAVADVVVVVVVAVTVTVVVDEQRLCADLEQAATEGHRQVLGLQHVRCCPIGDDATGQQHHPVGALGLLEVVRREDDGRTTRDFLVDDPQDASPGWAGRVR